MKKILYVFGLVVLWTACTKTDITVNNESSTDEPASPLSFTAETKTFVGLEKTTEEEANTIDYFGVSLRGKDGGLYDGNSYENVPFKSNGNEWVSVGKEVLITSTEGKMYAYYPYDESYTDINNIPFSISQQKDLLYSIPIDISSVNSSVSLSFHHALAVLNISIARNSDVNDTELREISLSGTGLAAAGKFDATTGTIVPSEAGQSLVFSYQNDYVPTLDEVSEDNSKALVKRIILVPNQLEDGTSTGLNAGTISIRVNLSGTVYTLTTKSAVSFKQGSVYNCSLTGITNGTFISETDNLTFVNDSGNQEFDVKKITGIMITDEKYLPGNHKLIVRLVYDGNTVKWCTTDDPFSDITSYPTTDGTNTFVELFDGRNSGMTHIEDGSWIGKGGALDDFDGKSNTAAMVKANGGYDGDKFPIIKVNAEALQQGWYIPALGQLAVIYKYRNALNAEIHRIIAAGGTAMDIMTGGFAVNWSSSTVGTGAAYCIYFDVGGCGGHLQSSSDWTRSPNLVRDAN